MENALFEILTTDPGIAAIASDNCFPIEIPQGLEYRGAITYQRVGGRRDHSMGGATGLVESRFHVNCWGQRDTNGSAYFNAKTLSRAVRGVFLPPAPEIFRKTVDGVEIQGIFINGEDDKGEEAAAGLRSVKVFFDCTIWHKE